MEASAEHHEAPMAPESLPVVDRYQVQTNQLTIKLGLNPQAVLDDLINAVNYYCAKGFDAFEDQVNHSSGLTKEQCLAISKGLVEIFEKVHNRLQHSLQDFEKQALAGCLSVPQDLTLQKAEPESPPVVVAEEEEAALDEQLQELRAQIMQAQLGKQRFNKQSAFLTRELASFGNAAPLTAVANAASSGKENLAEDTAAIAAKALQLRPMLDKAAHILQLCQEASAAKGNLQNAAAIAEKEIVRRKAAANGAQAEDLRQLQYCILSE